ncbi:YbjN domain-containing protein [Oceanicella actignis]|uniref:Sensory transduction regulator n=1 Tax=Oceanicella actignis TaxID=1189325 RepID=A0A1M7T3W0_9RHOB|nr:YbjN domain-containing protein [Oceanicella actignis]SET40318.1 hypothetical protein SAMN04488119_10497 [Oceanicella actignis]SHN65334.1 hypothetical protein SAMN05216200_10497 [Oceanicella actignis]
MPAYAHDPFAEDPHPIDLVQALAAGRSWPFDRVAPDRIDLAVQGAWRLYSMGLEWRAREGALRLLLTFDLAAPRRRAAQLELARAVNMANDHCWGGAFVVWPEHDVMAFRAALALAVDEPPARGRLEDMIGAAVDACERFVPAFELAAQGRAGAEAALEIVISDPYGRA